MCQTFGGSMSTMCSRESIIDIDIAVGCERLDEIGVILFFALMKTGVFEEQNITVVHRVDSGSGCIADAVFGESDMVLNSMCQSRNDLFQREFSFNFAFRTTEMREQNNLRATFA